MLQAKLQQMRAKSIKLVTQGLEERDNRVAQKGPDKMLFSKRTLVFCTKKRSRPSKAEGSGEKF